MAYASFNRRGTLEIEATSVSELAALQLWWQKHRVALRPLIKAKAVDFFETAPRDTRPVTDDFGNIVFVYLD